MGKRRIFVGGAKVPAGGSVDPNFVDDDEGQRRSSTVEPVVHHSGPTELQEELCDVFKLIGAIDLTPGDGRRVLTAIRRRIPYVGITLSDGHTTGL